MVGMEEIMWGRSEPLRGQLGPCYVFEDFLTGSQVKFLHNLGSNKTLTSEPSSESPSEAGELVSKLIFNFSSRVCSNFVCTNLSPSHPSSYDGHSLATPHTTKDAKDIINCLGGIQVR